MSWDLWLVPAVLIVLGTSLSLAVIALVASSTDNKYVRRVYTCLIGVPLHYAFKLLIQVAGAKTANSIADWLLYFFGLGTPLAQILYLALVVVGYLAFILAGYELLEDNLRVSSHHRWASFILISSCLLSYVLICQSDPGFIEDENFAEELAHNQFVPDGVYFLKDKLCTTCEFVKPGRSKHCPHCGGCIMKYDHHCIWLRNCLGLYNWRWFMGFCILHVVLCLYGVLLIIEMIKGEFQRRRVWQASFRINGVMKAADKWLVINYAMLEYPVLVGLLAICFAMGLSLVIFTAFHVYMHFWRCSTTNELTRPPQRKSSSSGDVCAPNTGSRLESIYQDMMPGKWLRSVGGSAEKKKPKRRRGVSADMLTPEVGDAPMQTRSGKILKGK